jgi:hypothetical protein
MKIYMLSKESESMDSKQTFMLLAIVVAFSSAMIGPPVMAQNMTGGNMAGENMAGSISGYEEDAECSKSPACIT